MRTEQSDLDNFVSQDYSNKTHLNAAKHSVIQLGTRDASHICRGSLPWKAVTEKYLGVTVDKERNMKCQCYAVAKRTNPVVRSINRGVLSMLRR